MVIRVTTDQISNNDERKSADLKSLSKRISKSLAAKSLSLNRLSKHEFACESDALTAATAFEKALPSHLLVDLILLRNHIIDVREDLDLTMKLLTILIRFNRPFVSIQLLSKIIVIKQGVLS